MGIFASENRSDNTLKDSQKWPKIGGKLTCIHTISRVFGNCKTEISTIPVHTTQTLTRVF